jgi:hypothetical protein
MRIRVFASGPLNFKAALPSKSKGICALSLPNKVPSHQAHRAIREIKEFMTYFMTSKIASSSNLRILGGLL